MIYTDSVQPIRVDVERPALISELKFARTLGPGSIQAEWMMARAAPGVDRVVSVLNFFAAHPDHGFTLTDVIRALKLNRATCHGLLSSLSESGYLYRDMAKTYRMGPALAAIGRVAHQSFAPVAAARDEMRVLADRHDLACIAASRVGNEMIFLERMASRSNLEPAYPANRRNMITPPGGSSFIAWASAQEIEAWLSAFDPPLDDGGRERVTAALARIRQLRFSYSIPSEALPDRNDPISLMTNGVPSRRGGPSYLPEFAPEIEPETLYPVTYISAPVLGASQEVLFTLSLWGFDAPLPGARILAIGEDLRESTSRIMRMLSPRNFAADRGAL